MRFIQYGLGPIGLEIAGLALARGYRLAGAFDIDPAKVGRPATDLLPSAPDLLVEIPQAAALAGRAEVALHSTQSRLAQVRPQLEALIEAGMSVISTCEELAFPWRDHAEEAAALDARAQRRSVTLVGLGVNPGFVMDVLPAVLAAPCREIRRVRVERFVDVGTRRRSLQQKVGVGLSEQAFRDGVAAGRVAHVGLPESAAMIADALGWTLETITETVEPMLDSRRTVRGLHQVCRGVRNGGEAVVLDLVMVTKVPAPRDTVVIEGDPPLRLEIPGGVQGDQATSAIVVNAIPRVLSAPPGLRLVTEIPLIPPRSRR